MRILLCIFSFVFISHLHAQEICDNAIDDDFDGLIDLNDPDCPCATALESSLIPNPSFEDTVCCPISLSQLSCAETWVQASTPTSDYYNKCDFDGEFWFGYEVESPYPGGGNAFAGFISYLETWNEYIGACLDGTMYAGTTYTLNLYTAAMTEGMDLDLSIFGTPNCDDLPWDGLNCPEGIGDWQLLTSEMVVYPEINNWIEVTLAITPLVDINAIAIGGPCYFGPEFYYHYYIIDELTLIESELFVDIDIEEFGGWCTGDLFLSASASAPGGTWQWYKDGIALLGETGPTLSPVPYDVGEFRVTYLHDGGCQSQTYHSPSISNLDFDFTNPICITDPAYFTNTTEIISGGPMTSWRWDFGDGEISTEEHTEHIFLEPGFIEVNLVGYSDDPTCNDSVSYIIDVPDPPVALFNLVHETVYMAGDFIVGCVNTEFLFDNVSTHDGDDPIVNANWLFGDGASSDLFSPTHSYTTADNYVVQLIVETEAGCIDTLEQVLYIASMDVNFSVDEACVMDETEFTNTTTIDGIISMSDFDWDFGDGGTSTAENPSHVYTADGLYEVTFIVTSGSGCSDSISKIVSPYPSPIAHFEFIADGISSEAGGTGGSIYNTVLFNDLSTIDPPGVITSWSWDFGDGGTSTDENPSHTYDDAGLYTVSLTVESDEGCISSTLIDILMTNGLVFLSADTTICQNGTATLIAESSGGSPHTYTWSIDGSDDGPIQTVGSELGTHYIYVYSTNEAGFNSPTDSVLVTVLPPIEITLFTPAQACIGETISCVVEVIGGDGDYTYDWMANGVVLADNTPVINHTPFVTTTYCVTVSDGCETSPITACDTTAIPEVPQFTSDLTSGCIGTIIEFTNLTTPADSIVEANWEINGEILYGPVVQYQFVEAGSYAVKLNVLTLDGCWSSLYSSDYIVIHDLPNPDFYVTPQPVTVLNNLINLVNISPNPTSSFEWFIPSGTPDYSTSHSMVEVLLPPIVNNYEIKLIETTAFNCKDSIQQTIYMEREHLVYAPNSFTPNGDGNNDNWQVFVSGLAVYDFHLTVYNRYGELIWESYDASESGGWDGTYGEHRIVQTGVYVWVLNARDSASAKRLHFEGTVNVIR